LKTIQPSYKTILGVAVPLMLGSAAQQIIVLSDNVFLYHASLEDFGAIALVGVFYLMIASIGYGFSRGGQILIARRYGEESMTAVGFNFYTLLLFQFLLALMFFLILQFWADDIFYYFIQSEDIYERTLRYIYPRSYGIFFSYLGCAMIALYTGIAKTKFIVIDTLILAFANVILNYIFIFGKFGIEPMGIEGAAWASTIAEMIAFICFVLYMLKDDFIRSLKIFKKPKFDYKLVTAMFNLSSPIVLQSIIGLGSWFVFFSMIEQFMGEIALEISNLGRNVYLILSIPSWGFAAGLNTLVSNMMGQQRPRAALTMMYKSGGLCFILTMLISIPVCLFPEFFLSPLFGGENSLLITASIPLLKVLILLLALFSVGSIFMNGVIGAGATPVALKIQIFATILYLSFAYYVLSYLKWEVHEIWYAEILYWGFILSYSLYVILSKKWIRTKV